MLFLTSSNRLQNRVARGLLEVLTEHSQISRESLAEVLQALSSRPDYDIIINGFSKQSEEHYSSFSLAIFPKGGSRVDPPQHIWEIVCQPKVALWQLYKE